MTNKLKYSLGVGIISVAALGALVYASFRMTSGNLINKKDSYSLYVVLEDAAGLSKGSSILSAGIRVGTIDNISLYFGKARIDLRILNNVPIYKDASISVASLGLLGDRYIKLSQGSPNMPYLKDGDRILTSIEPIGLDSSVALVGKVLETVRELVVRVDQILLEQNDNIDRILSNVAKLTENLNNTAESFNNDDINEIVSNINESLRGINQIIKNSQTDIGDTTGKLPEIADRINESSEQLNQLLKNVNQSLTLDSPVKKLISDEELGQKLDEAVSGMSSFFGSTGRLRIDLGFRLEYLGLDEQKGYLNLYYIPQKERFFIFQLMYNRLGRYTTSRAETITTNPTGTTRQTVVTRNLKQYLISAQIAQSYYDTTIRLGLFENTIGAGIDQYFGKNRRFRTTFEMFDFSRESNNPYLRGFVDWKLLGNAYVSIGLDDFINRQRGRRRVFFGVGLNFREENLQTIASGLSLIR